MSQPVNKTLIGAFIVGAVFLALASVVLLNVGLFRRSNEYVMYFTGSVKGLSIGAPVQLKGVPLGKVTHINLVYDETSEVFLNEVIFEVTQGSVKTIEDQANGTLKNQRIPEAINVERMIESGLRAKLTIQSFVTGQLVVAFDFYPGTPVNLKGHGGDLIELPTLPSDMDALSKTLDTIDIEAIATSIEDAVHGFEDLVNSPELKASISTLNLALKDYRRLAVNLNNRASQLSGELSDTLAETRHLIRTTDGHIPPIAAGITETTDDLRKTIAGINAAIPPVLTRAEATLANLQHLSDPDSALLYRLEETLTESKKAFRALALLADYLSRHPEALLQGKPAVKEER